jgi:murein L,D-transpeptidase YafK
MASAAIAAAIALGGCQTDEGTVIPERALRPLSPEMVSTLERKNMPKDSPILVRLFKEESELEVWKQDGSGRFALLKTYPICRWSGELGPKVREGDRQAPEGFYTINPGQMNPNSNYYLAINIGFPNAYDRANGRSGDFLMIHGDCSSRGCYAMTDEQIGEIYALAREAFFGGQRSFQVQAYPFHMTPINMARHRSNPNMAFWKMLKQGYDHFEVTRQEPKVSVCDKRYVFDAEPPGYVDGQPIPASFRFNPTARCPAFQVPQEIAEATAAKQKQDEIETAALIQRGTPVAPIRTYTDGGMNQVFVSALHPQVVRDSEGNVRMVIDGQRAPGTVPLTANPPHAPENDGTTGSVHGGYGLASKESKPAPKTQVATAKPSSESGNIFTHLFTSQGDAPRSGAQAESGSSNPLSRLFGSSEENKPAQPPRVAAVPPAKQASPARPKAAPTNPAASAQPATAQAAPKSPPPQAAATPAATNNASAPTAADSGLLSNQPISSNGGSFDSRWGNLR